MTHASSHSVRWLRIAVAVAFLLTHSACIGIPTHRQSVNHIIATGWTKQGIPVALAQQAVLGRTAYAMSAEGPGVFESYRLGTLLLLKGDSHIRAKVPAGLSEVEVTSARSMPTDGGFLLLADVRVSTNPNGTERHCFTVDLEGEVRPCLAPDGYRFEAFTYYIEPLSSKIYYRRPAEPGSRFEVLDVTTGEVIRLENEFLALGLHFPNDLHAPRAPCEMENAALSPSHDVWAVACSIRHDSDTKEGIWLVRRSAAPQLLFEFKTADIAVPKGFAPTAEKELEDLVTWPHEETTLIWSPDQDRLYWCGGRGREGVVVPLAGGPAIRHSPCLKLGAWSPDGKAIAGIAGRKFTVWRIASEPAF